MARREFLQLAEPFSPAKHQVAFHYISEKLDGTRCFWDGGLSRGLRTEDIPWRASSTRRRGRRRPRSSLAPRGCGLAMATRSLLLMSS